MQSEGKSEGKRNWGNCPNKAIMKIRVIFSTRSGETSKLHFIWIFQINVIKIFTFLVCVIKSMTLFKNY